MEGAFSMRFRWGAVVAVEKAALDSRIARADRCELKDLLKVRARSRTVLAHPRADNDAMERGANRRHLQIVFGWLKLGPFVFGEVW